MNNQDLIIIGVDEAGRGAVIGPLSITSVVLTPQQEKNLIEIIKYDSKKYSKATREKLFHEIIDDQMITAYHNVLIHPSVINNLMGNGVSLNVIEVNHMVLAIEKCLEKIDIEKTSLKIYVDSMYTNPSRCKFNFIHKLYRILKETRRFDVICEHKADEKYVSVRVASIISKVIRDMEIEKLHKIYGDFGSGYPSDPKTRSFLKKAEITLSNNKIYSIVRIYWKTWKNMVGRDVEEDKFL